MNGHGTVWDQINDALKGEFHERADFGGDDSENVRSLVRFVERRIDVATGRFSRTTDGKDRTVCLDVVDHLIHHGERNLRGNSLFCHR